MSEEIDTGPSRGQLRQEAADWFAVMRGPEAELRRLDFNAWLASSPDHRRAYNSVTETFNITKGLKRETEESTVPGDRTRFRRGQLVMLLCTVAVAVVLSLSLGWWTWSRQGQPVQGATSDQIARADREARFATSIGEIRNFVLIDGSRMTLDTNSIVLASYTNGERGLRLVQGRARFFVSHEARPFIVRADTTVVRARGTVFDVTLLHKRKVAVRLIEGSVDVQSQPETALLDAGRDRSAAPITMRLESGQQLSIEVDQLIMSRLSVQGDESWPDGVQAFNDVSLSDLIAVTNRYARQPVVIADPEIRAKRVSGTFHLTDTGSVVQKVADLLDLSVTQDANSYRLRPH